MNDQQSFIDIIDTITNNYKLLHTMSGIWGTNDIHYEIKEEYHNVNYENPHEVTDCTAARSFIEEDGSVGILYTSITKTTYSSCKEPACNVPYPDKEHYKYSVWDVYEHYEEYLPEIYKILGWGEEEYSIFENVSRSVLYGWSATLYTANRAARRSHRKKAELQDTIPEFRIGII